MSWSPPSQPSGSPAPVVVVIHASAAPQVVHIHLHPHPANGEPQLQPPSTSPPAPRFGTPRMGSVSLGPPPAPTLRPEDNQPPPPPPAPAPAWRRVQSSPAALGDPFAESEQWFNLHAHRPPSRSPTWLGPSEPAWRSVRREHGLELFVDSPASPALFPQTQTQPQPQPQPQPTSVPQPQRVQMHQLHHEQQLRSRRAYVETDTETDADTSRSRSVVSRLIHLTDTESVVHLRRSTSDVSESGTRLSDPAPGPVAVIRTVPVSHPENDDTEPEPEAETENQNQHDQEELFEAARALWAQTHQEEEDADAAREEAEQVGWMMRELHERQLQQQQQLQDRQQQQLQDRQQQLQDQQQQQQLQDQQQQQQQYTFQQTPYYTLHPPAQSQSQSQSQLPRPPQPLLLAQLTPTSLDEPLLPRPSQTQAQQYFQFQPQSQVQPPQRQSLYQHEDQAQAQSHFQFHSQPNVRSPRSLLHAQLYPAQPHSHSHSPRAQFQLSSTAHSHQPTSLQPTFTSQPHQLSGSLNPFLSPPPQRRVRPSTWHDAFQAHDGGNGGSGPQIVHPDAFWPPSQPAAMMMMPRSLVVQAGRGQTRDESGSPRQAQSDSARLPGQPAQSQSQSQSQSQAVVSPRPGNGNTNALSPQPNTRSANTTTLSQQPSTLSPPRPHRHPALAGSGAVYRPPSAHVPPSPNLHLVEPWNWVDHPHPQAWGVVPS